MNDSAAFRRASATNEIMALVKDISERIDSGPRHKGRTTYQDANNFEAVRDALRQAQFLAICLQGAA